MKLYTQMSFGQSHSKILIRRKNLRELNALHRALPVYPVFQEEKTNVSDKKNRSIEKPHKNTTGLI